MLALPVLGLAAAAPGASPGPSVPVPRGATPSGDGVVVGDGPVVVDAYVDFQCPFCRQFEQLAGDTLDQLLAGHAIALVTHPMDFLDAVSTTRYSTRAAAASGAAADAGMFREYARTLFANQPPEGGPGLTDDQLIALGQAIGITDPAFAETIRNGTYLPWPPYVTERAVQRGVAGTPSVFVAGVPVPARPEPIVAAVRSILA
ncbi:thioredoxin domain-containing protein [Pseudonocardia bannensis]|uniref:Thioredoxin domain-containing protein n=2 Tax=Pseudonocardia bannensis TaxID=630973 RepID=A0A848DHU9_9PSEU|nr:thioredoxin domain-containing protein [Pseudonocardia bannensis]